MSEAKKVSRRKGDDYAHPVKAAVSIGGGRLVVIDGTGFAQEGHEAAGLTVAGLAHSSVDNSKGADGAKTVSTMRGKELYRFENDVADPVTRAHLNASCYIVDSETVSSSSNTSARSEAGIVRDLDDTGVWVEFN
ncbi:hypothetical protein SAMN04515647_1610 [Cohaesibacter sp. ES.047]|uniref:hypothetical protein n=1 Tax=Cohaesibacter sp. ES.047 TaxID=1798205 RepID=UPI000BB84654|nr:hypothetical protein [Cohaesibacter sp. ES.047]SNY91388.1 hypothetical protein SAMN04515647_1610 [Cohaesibacter sp. ES.047]